jgi:molybdate transport system ATP-binding protein
VTERQLTVSLHQAAPIPLDVAFTCEPGQVLAIFGASGSGKTTILRSIAGLHQPARAQVRVGHQVWCDTDAGVCLPPHRRAVGLVFQEYALFPHLTALGNVMAASGHRPRSERRAHAEALLERVHLTSLASRQPHELSGGERQRVALARALAREPSVMLLDEPFAAVDRGVRRRLQDEVAALRQATTVPLILVTHDVDDVVRLASHVLVLERGRVLAVDSVERLTSRPDLAFLREAFGLGSVFDAVVTQVDIERRLLALTFDGGRLLTPLRDSAPGARVRVRVPAREVILASAPPDGLSLHNVLAGTVAAMHEEPTTGQVVVQVAVGRLLLLAEVTRDAVQRLALAPGRPVHALIKSVSVDAYGSDSPGPPEVVR